MCTPTEERGGEKGGNANFKTKLTEPLTQEITLPLYTMDPYCLDMSYCCIKDSKATICVH